MNNLDDTDANAKISDSAYSNSCSNSQSRRSQSSKSTHSGSNSSGSSGYGGKPSTSGSSNNNSSQTPKKDKDSKKKKHSPTDVIAEIQAEVECGPPLSVPKFLTPSDILNKNAAEISSPERSSSEKGVENMDISSPEPDNPKDEVVMSGPSINTTLNQETSRLSSPPEGFSCVISMHDGVVLYTTLSLTATLGFPKDMWVGRSFIDFIHPKDRNTFASQITSGLAVPKIVNGTQEKVLMPGNHGSSIVCRIRKYRGLRTGFGVKDATVAFMPFLLKLTFKDVHDEEGKVIYLVVQATPLYSAFKTANEKIPAHPPFMMRHNAKGILDYIDPESVSYLGYLPQDIINKDIFKLYHRQDLPYLRQVYESIVKEGGLNRTKPYRMLTQNGDYVKLVTEWTSFINPWSRKLEFVIAKHIVVEGPTKPDVFQPPSSTTKKAAAVLDEEKKNAQGIRDSIVKVMNEVLTKPAELAKQQMSKRCQELTSFMESLMEQQPKTEEELRLEIQDPENNNYERDSVMLGGISPHHDYSDSKSSTETPLSYNQLNYNENLQRYFDTHQPYSYEDYNTITGDNIFGLKNPQPVLNTNMLPPVQNSRESAGLTSASETTVALVNGNPGDVTTAAASGEYKHPRLTENILTKHNADMEKELVKYYRETRSSSKGERDKVTNESRKKKKEHLARCNAPFQNTAAVVTFTEPQPHGLKRASKATDVEAGSHKHHCPSQRQFRKKSCTSATITQPTNSMTTTVAANHWNQNHVNNMNTFYLGVGIPQQMSLMSPMSGIPSVYPMYYTPTTGQAVPTPPEASNAIPSCSPPQFQTPMQCMIYGQPVYGSPFVYSPINTQVSYPMPQMEFTNTLGLATSNYEEACKSNLLRTNNSSGQWHGTKCSESQATSTKTDQGSGQSSTNALKRSTEAVPETSASRDAKSKTTRTSEGTVDRTDGESSYSSFYSSFFKTESGSAEDSDAKKIANQKNGTLKEVPKTETEITKPKLMPKRKMEPPWMEQVCVTSELIYKYQIMTKNVEEVLKSDKEKMSNLEQPSLVNEQLGQLYLDLQLEGVAAKLSLEEGVTSSSSSGEDNGLTVKGITKDQRKRQYSKLVMIYEEDAPLPSGSETEEVTADNSI